MGIVNTIIISCWALLLSYWTICAFFQKKVKEKQNLLGRLFYSITLFLSILLFLVSSKIFLLSIIIIKVSMLINILSVTFSILGLVICVYSRTLLGNNWSREVVLKKNHKLITNGIYRYVRHPIYLGLLLLYFGTALAIGNFGSIIGFFILIISFILKLKEEESLMIKKFGRKYLDYMKRTERLIPYLF